MTSVSGRTVTPELLDSLSPLDPEAVASRRDLRRINALMFNSRILARLMRAHAGQPPRNVLELGCGDGRLSLALARRLAAEWPGVHLTLVDAQPVVPDAVLDAMARLGWTVEVQRCDAFDWLDRAPPQNVVCCNLFLHHFEGAALARLLGAIAAASPVCVAVEPRRGAIARIAASSLALIGANSVTRHDAAVSVRAGFQAGELGAAWTGRAPVDRAFGPFSHGFVGVSGG